MPGKNENRAEAVSPPAWCGLCPRLCGADRRSETGRCGGGPLPRIARAAPHFWEEPCISGTGGSGAVFFSGCPLGCVFCQNHTISRQGTAGRTVNAEQLAGLYLELEAKGVHNLNLVTATHYLPWVQAALGLARQSGLALPVVWNTGGYETPGAMRALAEFVDIWLFDLKFHSAALAARLAGAADYFTHASRAAQMACEAAGPPVYDSAGLMRRGVVIRLLALPGQSGDAAALLRWMADALPRGGFVLSLMSQYTPPPGLALPPPLHRRLASLEYRRLSDEAARLGLENGYTQRRSSAGAAYIPPFDF